MSELRNLTKEAIELAERAVIQSNPKLASAAFRKNLDPMNKQFLVLNLIQLAQMFENELINNPSFRE